VDNSNGNLTLTRTASYQCSSEDEYPQNFDTKCTLTLTPFDERHKAFFFVDDKVYLDITKLFKFKVNLPVVTYNTVFCRSEDYIEDYRLDPGNINAEFNINVIFLGVTFTVGVRGPKNYTGKTKSFHFGTRTLTRTFTPGTINIEGKKYYPYQNSEGEAVYNEDTGAELTNPLG
jgi:hypothetical protein